MPRKAMRLDGHKTFTYLRNMPIRPVITAPDPRLKALSKPVEKVGDDTRALMDDMLESMYAAKGIGLAAIQVGTPLRIIVMDLAHDGEEPEPTYFVNPEILWTSDERVLREEGCLSVPSFYEEVERPERCRVSYLDYDGKAHELEADGMLGTCIQHEIDHLDGVLFIDHISRLKRTMTLRKLAKAKKQEAAAAI